MISPFAEPTLQLANDWYRDAQPVLMDQNSFATFLRMNESTLMSSGVLVRIANKLYVVNPFFDNYMRLNVSFGLLSKVLASRSFEE